MVRIEDFHIQFDDKWAVYHPGDIVTGTVNLRINDKIFVDSAIAHFYGQARVLWTQREVKGSHFLNVSYTSDKIYFDAKLELWRHAGKAAKEKNGHCQATSTDDAIDKEIDQLLNARQGKLLANSGRHMEPGNHSFKFAYQLPADLPTSFDSRHSAGYIRYSVKVCLMSEDNIKHSRKAYFSVVKPEDLNLMAPVIGHPVFKEAKKLCKAGVFASSKGQRCMSLSATLGKSGYVPGEPIVSNVILDNQSTKSVKALKLHLVQTVICHVDRPEVVSKKTIQTVCTVGNTVKIRPGEKNACPVGPLFIPAVVPTFDEDNSIQVSYHVSIEAYRDNDSPKLSVHFPIIIGTVPLKDQTGKTVGAVPHGPVVDAPPLYDSVIGIPPPSYEESVSGISGDNGKDEGCIPRYMVYNY